MKDLLTSLVRQHFPQVQHAIGYGSAVFKQANYQALDTVIDMILIVKDTRKFH
jgi:hypothetical protein